MPESGAARPRGIRQRAEEALAEGADDSALPRVRDELLAVAELLRHQPRLRKTLSDVGVPAEAKSALLRGLLGDRTHPATLSVLALLVADDGLSYRLRPVLEDLAVQAVLVEADRAGTLTEATDALFRFSRLVRSNVQLRRALTDPFLPPERKRSLVEDLLAGQAPEQAVFLASWAATRPGDPTETLEGLADRAAGRHSRVVVEARTAVPLDQGRHERLASALASATGLEVDLEVTVDPTVVGGVVSRVGDEVIDGTVRHKLQLAMELLTT
jgi:F-type H+-transporting ATPase subunit delta